MVKGRETWHVAVHRVAKSQTRLSYRTITTTYILGRKVMTNLDSIFKRRDITLPTKVRLGKAMVFLVSCMDVRVGL